MLERVIPHTDLFFPSVEELLMMLEPEHYAGLKAKDEDLLKVFDLDELPRLGRKLLDMGAKIVAIKCGSLGFYARAGSTEDIAPLISGGLNADTWAGREVFSGVYNVPRVASAVGAGDASIAAFLAAMLRGWTLNESVDAACAAGALCVTDFSATGALQPLEETCRIAKEDFGKL